MYWTPKTWKRSNFLLVSVFTDLALLISIEFSYSNLFNQNQWYVIIAFKVAEIPINYLLRVTLQESLLTMPMQVMVDLVQFMITIGASNFVNFIYRLRRAGRGAEVRLSTHNPTRSDPHIPSVSPDLSLCCCMCVCPALGTSSAYGRTTLWTRASPSWRTSASGGSGSLRRRRRRRRSWQRKRSKKAASGPFGYLWGSAASGGKDESDSEDEAEMVAPVLNSHETSEEILAPIVEFYSDYSAKVISLFFSVPVLMYFLYLFRSATQMTVNWGIAQHDMYFYFLFICILLPFMMLLDIVLVQHQGAVPLLEAVRLPHATCASASTTALSGGTCTPPPQPSLSEEKGRGKQINRAVSGDTMDMAMPRAWRSLDHMCFSGQYYFMLLVHTGGMVFLLIALEVFIHNNYNPFNDLLGLAQCSPSPHSPATCVRRSRCCWRTRCRCGHCSRGERACTWSSSTGATRASYRAGRGSTVRP